ncbi:hypothetical protein [Actinoplanes solisilvae]|uniref:hypothetical protein n=1 Tax=Actinoplanes solisilvae TaxID=2486853 RepID=UPI000FD7503A|nr:hypothetical protein [Actinoplanes solisilvae]
MNDKSSPSEPLTWGVAATVSRDAFVRQRAGRKRPGTRHFVPGAKIWVLPVIWGDGGDQRYVVGTRRGTGGRSLIRLVMNTDYLVNYRVRPVYSPKLYAAMGQPGGPRLYPSREEAGEVVRWWKWERTRMPHLLLQERPGEMHNADETCEFCDGRDAARAGVGVEGNPYTEPSHAPAGTVDWWSTDHGMWQSGWLTETHRVVVHRLSDLGLQHIALDRRRMRARAESTARTVVGRTVAELEADGLGRNRLRFIRGDYQPRVMDGIVHAWLDETDRVIRTQAG